MFRMNRREWLSNVSFMGAGAFVSSWLGGYGAYAANNAKPKRSCILLWMSGGPSQTDTFDMKPRHENGGPFKAVATRTPGVVFSEHLAKLAQWTDQMAIVRSMSTKEGDHGRATQHLRTGYLPQGSIQFPAIGSLVANERADINSDLPNYVSIIPRGVFAPGRSASGFLGPKYAPLIVGQSGSEEQFDGPIRVDNLRLPARVRESQAAARLDLLKASEEEFLQSHPGVAVASHRHAYEQATKLMSPSAAKAFSLDEEPKKLRDDYGRNKFGQGCLLARRLVERHVPFVEVTLGGWDTHNDNFSQVQKLSQILDPAWATLMADLKSRGLLESTLVVWMGEFGRTPAINPQQGRDHYPKAWSVVLSGGGIRGGQTVGRTSADGMNVEDRPVSVPDIVATICTAIGLDPRKQNMSNVDRPIRLADPDAKPLLDILV